VAVALPWPGAAAAQATKESLSTVQAKGTHGFGISLVATGSADLAGPFSSLSVYLAKHSGRGVGSWTESVAFRFTVGVSFSGSSDLSSAQITGTLPRGRGSIAMTFNATSAPAAVALPKGCTGTPGEERKGLLTGSLNLRADRLGTESLASINATLTLPPSINECGGGPPHGRDRTAIEAEGSRGGHGAYLFASKPSGNGSVREGVSVFDVGDGFAFSWSYVALVPRSDYTFSSDLGKATLKGADGIHGTATYNGSPAHDGASHGKLGGGLWAKFTSIGIFRPLAHIRLRADQFRG
jgi:hypothetical protein